MTKYIFRQRTGFIVVDPEKPTFNDVTGNSSPNGREPLYYCDLIS